MKKFYAFCFMVFALTNSLNSQTTPPAVTNVVTQVSPENDKVTVTYDLARRPGVTNYNIVVKITLDGENIDSPTLSGDIGPNVTPGYGKRIVWDVLKDVNELYGKLQVEVTSKTTTPDCVPMKTIPVWAGLGGAFVAGSALVIGGLQLESDSKEVYDVYKNNLDPNAPVYDELTREEHYQTANSDHKKGTWMIVGGASVIVAGGVIMISRLIQINKYNKDCAGKTSDASTQKWNIKPIVDVGSTGNNVSAGIAINF